MMDKKLKRAWIKALRSGKYKQGPGVLEKVDAKGRVTNCCLGVLCRVAGVRASRPDEAGNRSFDGGKAFLSDKLRRRFKISVYEHNKLTDNERRRQGRWNPPQTVPWHRHLDREEPMLIRLTPTGARG